MSDISVFGLGLMGSALARVLQQAGHKITVWNRSSEKMVPFVAEGATGAPSVVSAAIASPVLLVCVDSYDVTMDFLGSDEVAPHLAGRTLIQLSTGTPREALDAAAWFNNCGVAYIDGAILVLPSGIGTEDAQILFAGPKREFRQVEPILQCLGGNLRYLGENVRAAATLNLAWLCQRLGLILGAVHGALLCKSEDVGTDIYATIFPEGDRVQMLAQVIHLGEFGKPDVTVRAWHAVLQRLQRQARESEISSEFPGFAAGILERAIAAGYGEEDVAALIKVMRAT
jgi:3-hydroxyisobutyrate dehydrogenase-like beta-hydroxyacid dehydrogenase